MSLERPYVPATSLQRPKDVGNGATSLRPCAYIYRRVGRDVTQGREGRTQRPCQFPYQKHD